jgi:hypothetical protein
MVVSITYTLKKEKENFINLNIYDLYIFKKSQKRKLTAATVVDKEKCSKRSFEM